MDTQKSVAGRRPAGGPALVEKDQAGFARIKGGVQGEKFRSVCGGSLGGSVRGGAAGDFDGTTGNKGNEGLKGPKGPVLDYFAR